MPILYPPDFSLSKPFAPPASPYLVERLLAFYKKQPAPELSQLWQDILKDPQAELKAALEFGNPERLGEILSRMYEGQMVWGMDAFNTMPGKEACWQEALLRLANAAGTVPLFNPEQPNQAREHNQSLEQVLAGLDDFFGVKLNRVPCGSMIGLEQDGRFLTQKFLDALTLIINLPDRQAQNVLELGAGLATLPCALKLLRGFVYHTIDLPTVAVMQAYLLSYSFGEKALWLAGEAPDPAASVLIHGLELPQGFNFDLVINQDSLPEMPDAIQDRFLKFIAARLRQGGRFFSVNQESGHVGQRRVAVALENLGVLQRIWRKPFWGRAGYVEEVWQKP